MEVLARGKYIRMSPRKVGLVTDLIREKKVEEAVNILRFSKKRAATEVLKVLDSAVANARNNFNLNEKNLIVSKAVSDPGPTSKRGRFVSRGRWVRILKRTSHITIGVAENKDQKPARSVGGSKVKEEVSK